MLGPSIRNRALSGFLQFDFRRVFINPVLGCPASCIYCYLHECGYAGKPVLMPISARELLRIICNEPSFVDGKYGHVLSIGCFSEPFERTALEKTLEIVQSLATLGNPIQLATKHNVSERVAKDLAKSISYENQLAVFVSISSFLRWQELEPGTTAPTNRIKAIATLRKIGIPACLYIKPTIPGITDAEIEIMQSVVKECNPCGCVVGNLYATDKIVDNIVRANPLTNKRLYKNSLERENCRFPISDYLGMVRSPADTIVDRVIRGLRKTGIPCFKSSTCSIAYNLKIPNPLSIWSDDQLCVRCQDCERLCNELPTKLQKLYNNKKSSCYEQGLG